MIFLSSKITPLNLMIRYVSIRMLHLTPLILFVFYLFLSFYVFLLLLFGKMIAVSNDFGFLNNTVLSWNQSYRYNENKFTESFVCELSFVINYYSWWKTIDFTDYSSTLFYSVYCFCIVLCNYIYTIYMVLCHGSCYVISNIHSTSSKCINLKNYRRSFFQYFTELIRFPIFFN